MGTTLQPAPAAKPLAEPKDQQSAPASQTATDDREKMSLDALRAELHASFDGLTQHEAQSRLEHYGYNELPETKVNPLLKFLSYFWGPIPWMIEVAAILSVVVGHWSDFGIILSLIHI